MADTQPSPPEHRVRKRRRRTIACTQCRSRKLRCDREYPVCGRCVKSRTPAKCTYEDGFLWQQPNTVASNSFNNNSDRRDSINLTANSNSTNNDNYSISVPPNVLPRVVDPNARPDSGLSSLSDVRSIQERGEGNGHGDGKGCGYRGGHRRGHEQLNEYGQPSDRNPATVCIESDNKKRQPVVEERRDRFLETVLGAPKAEEPYAPADVFHRPRRPEYYPHITPSHHTDYTDGNWLASPSQKLDISPRIMMRGKETQTRFNGAGILANLIAQFGDLKQFAEELRLSYPNLAQLRPEFDKLKRGLYKNNLGEPIPDPVTSTLIELLPSRRAVDELVGLYLTYIESVYRILHVPSFFRELDEFWSRKDNPDAVAPAFVVQLLLILCCAWNLADPDSLQYKNEGRLKCYTAVKWIVHAEKWIQNTPIKRPEITAFRISCLLIIAHNNQGMKRSRAWLATGTLVKQAMLAGYHRDPGNYSKISAFNKEMRRRIWTAIVELDLQVALDRGMPPSVQTSDYDCAPVANINDDEINESSVELPAESPLDHVTDSSFQAFLARCLPVRLQACAMMHSPQITCSYDEIQRMDWELNKQLFAIPAWSNRAGWDMKTRHKVILWKALLETKIAQSLLSLHTPFAIETPKEPLFAPSARTRLEMATAILSTQRRSHETSRQLSLCNLGDWTIQATGSICQILYSSDSGDHSTFLTRSLPGFAESLLSLVDVTLLSLEARLLLVAKGAREYFYMSAILALVRTKIWPEQAAVFKQQVVDRILALAQALFRRHVCCSHLSDPVVGILIGNQVPGSAPNIAFEGATQPMGFNLTPPTDFDPFLDVFDWEDLTGIAFGNGEYL